MPNVNFKTIPTDVPLTVENIDRLANRAAELATAFGARIANIQQQVADARDRFSRDGDDLVRETDAANRAVAKQFAKRQLASRIAKFRLTIVESSRGQREELLRPLAKVAADAAFLLTLCQSPAQMLGRVAWAMPGARSTRRSSKAQARSSWKPPRSPRLPPGTCLWQPRSRPW